MDHAIGFPAIAANYYLFVVILTPEVRWLVCVFSLLVLLATTLASCAIQAVSYEIAIEKFNIEFLVSVLVFSSADLDGTTRKRDFSNARGIISHLSLRIL